MSFATVMVLNYKRRQNGLEVFSLVFRTAWVWGFILAETCTLSSISSVTTKLDSSSSRSEEDKPCKSELHGSGLTHKRFLGL